MGIIYYSKSMKTIAKACALLVLLLTTSFTRVDAQQLLWGASPFQDSLWSVDTTNWSIVNRLAPSLPGFTITGMTGMAYDPCEHETYVIMKVSGVSGRVLGTIDLFTGVCTQVGNLGDNFSSITFREDGQLFGLTGNGASVPETLYEIDKTTGTKVVATTLGNGADGEVIAYNYDDDMFYHWSGNGTVVYEKLLSAAPYTVTNIPISGTTNGEVFGAIYLGNNYMLVSNISSGFNRYQTNGVVSPLFGSNPDDLRGLVMPPRFVLGGDTICQNADTISVAYTGFTTDTVIYHWGDGTTTSVFPAASASHAYSTTGNMDIHIVLSNACNPSDTVSTLTGVVVLNVPLVAITPGDTAVCDSPTVLLQGTGGGSSQWYMNGVLINGATNSSYTATAPGVYNMIKTNLNGCADSAAVGSSITFGSAPVVNIGSDLLSCDAAMFCFGTTPIANATYAWSEGSTTDSICTNVGGQYILTVTSAEGCVASDTLVLSAETTPAPQIAVDTSACPTITFNGQAPNGTSWAWSFGDGNSDTVASPTHTYASNLTYAVSVTTTNICGTGSDSLSLVVNCVIAIDNSIRGSIFAYPNPVRDFVRVRLVLDEAMDVSYELLDLTGRVIEQGTSGIVQNHSFEVPMSVSAGAYILRVRAAEGVANFRLVKE